MNTTRSWTKETTSLKLKKLFVYLIAVSVLCFCSFMFTKAGEPENDAEIAKRARLMELLREETESDIQLEAWMLAIDIVEESGFYISQQEVELKLESWMMDLNLPDKQFYEVEIAEIPREQSSNQLLLQDISLILKLYQYQHHSPSDLTFLNSQLLL